MTKHTLNSNQTAISSNLSTRVLKILAARASRRLNKYRHDVDMINKDIEKAAKEGKTHTERNLPDKQDRLKFWQDRHEQISSLLAERMFLQGDD